MTVDVKDYIDSAPESQRPLLRELDAAVRKAFPDAALDPKSYFPMYAVDGDRLAGYATRKKGAMFYCMDLHLIEEFAERLGEHRSGNTCVEYRVLKTLTHAQLKRLVAEILAKQARRYADGTGGTFPVE
jgi:uncharacterized protein YdhG (YjbR/CyaY superfamily)